MSKSLKDFKKKLFLEKLGGSLSGSIKPIFNMFKSKYIPIVLSGLIVISIVGVAFFNIYVGTTDLEPKKVGKFWFTITLIFSLIIFFGSLIKMDSCEYKYHSFMDKLTIFCKTFSTILICVMLFIYISIKIGSILNSYIF